MSLRTPERESSPEYYAGQAPTTLLVCKLILPSPNGAALIQPRATPWEIVPTLAQALKGRRAQSCPTTVAPAARRRRSQATVDGDQSARLMQPWETLHFDLMQSLSNFGQRR